MKKGDDRRQALIDTAALGEIVRIEQPLIDEIKVVFKLKD